MSDKLSDSELAAKIVTLFFSFNDELSKQQLAHNLMYFKEFHDRFPEDSRVKEAYAGYLIISTKIHNLREFDQQINDLLESWRKRFQA